MNWKEFFRPSIGKIIVVIVLVLLCIIITDFYSRFCVIMQIFGGSGGFGPGSEAPPYCALIILLKNFVNPLRYEIIGDYVGMVLLPIIYFIYYYLLSCIIVSLYHKIRKK